MPVDVAERSGLIAANLAAVRARISAACAAAGRDPSEITLVAVTKTYPASDVALLAAAGVREIGENREQEAAPKAAELAARGIRVRWHHIGQLQRNKARSVASYASVVQSVDRIPLVAALAAARSAVRAADPSVPPLDCLIQVSLDADPERGGAPRSGVPALAEAILAAPDLRLTGLMAVAPLSIDPERAFAALAAIAEEFRAAHPDATVLSAGMSADLEAAVKHGATHVRVGSALLGTRPPLR